MTGEIDFAKMQGLAPAIVQDAANGEVLMLGFMNRRGLRTHAVDRLCDTFTAAPAINFGQREKPPATA